MRERLSLYTEPPHLTISETVNHMIVHHTDRLHVRVYHRGSDEAESAPLDVLLNASDSRVVAGVWRSVVHRFCRGRLHLLRDFCLLRRLIAKRLRAVSPFWTKHLE